MNPRRLRLAAALLTLLVTAGVHAQVKVARHVDTHVHADKTVVIHEEGAAFIKVYLKDVTAPVKVRSPDKREQYLYAPGRWKQATRRGDSYGALSISGDTAVVEFLGRGTATITGWDIGLAEPVYQDNGTPEITCEGDDKKWIACFDGAIYERRRPVAKIIMFQTGTACTAWRVGPGNKLLTNNHCTNSQEGVAQSEVWFNYQYSDCAGQGSIGPTIKMPAAELLDTYRPFDYTLFTVPDSPELQSFGWFGVEARQGEVGDPIYMIGHPETKPKRGIVESNGDLCRIDIRSQPGLGFEPDADYGYDCDSAGGQSGSPVIDAQNGRAIGLHHLGGTSGTQCMNGGVKMANIWPRISGFFAGVPTGDNETQVPAPTAVLQFSCRDNVCDYGSDGSVGTEFLWHFGDGGTSTAPSGVKTYTETAVYTVSLYVSRNGLTDAVHQTLPVTMPGETIPPEVAIEFVDKGDYVGCLKAITSDVDGQVVAWDWTLNDGGVAVKYAVAEFCHTFRVGGEHRAFLAVTDDKGGMAKAQSVFTVTGPVMNQSPVANFTWRQTAPLAVQFTDASTDDDTITHYQWYFGDGASDLKTINPGHVYPEAGTYDVRHYVYDSWGAGHYVSVKIPVTDDTPPPNPCGNGSCDAGETWETCPADCPKPPDPCGNGVCDAGETYQTCPADCAEPPPPIVLTVTAKKESGNSFPATFRWSGAVGATVELRGPDGTVETLNDREESLRLHNRNKGSRWQLCDAVQCSKPVTVNF